MSPIIMKTKYVNKNEEGAFRMEMDDEPNTRESYAPGEIMPFPKKSKG